jgi:hypothetical protein
MGEKRNAYRILVGKPERNIQLLRQRRKLEDNIKIILEIWDASLWIGLIWLRIGTSRMLL